MNKVFKVGSYVKYHGINYIVIDVRGNGLVQLYNPQIEGVDSKKQVSVKNTDLLNIKPAIIVLDRGNKYIVTHRRNIISLASGKVVYADPRHGVRRNIIANAEIQWFKQSHA